MVLGSARPIEDETAKRAAFDALVEHLVPGRTQEARGPNDHETRATTILEFPLEEVSAKVRTGPPLDEEEDLSLDVWAGVIPLTLKPGTPEQAPDLKDGIDTPAYVTGYHRPRRP